MTQTNAKINFNVTGAKRKELVSLISNFTGCEAKYKGAPTFAYEVDYFTIDKNGTLIFDDRADSEVIERLLEMLYDNSFVAENSETEEEQPQTEGTGLTIEMPRDKVDVENLLNLLESKGELIKAALGIEDIAIEALEDKVIFPWFGDIEADDAKAYAEFISAICKMTKEQTRINKTAVQTDNPKYAFRCFLLRLGFIGTEYKATRKILLRNLEGNSAFKSGKKKEVTDND